MTEKRVRILLAVAIAIIVLVFCMVFFRFPSNVGADFIYTTDENGNAIIGGYSGEKTTLEVPAEIDGHKVIAIGSSAFAGNRKDTKKIVLPAGVQTIGEEAFAFAEQLQTVVLPEGLTHIGARAFYGCRALKAPDLPQSLVSIGDEAFYGCTGLGKMKIPASLTFIGIDAFASSQTLILDVSDNEMAAAYAKEHFLETGTLSDHTVYLIVVIVTTALMLALAVILIQYVTRAMALRRVKKADGNGTATGKRAAGKEKGSRGIKEDTTNAPRTDGTGDTESQN